MSKPVILQRPNFKSCKHGNAAVMCSECEPVMPRYQQEISQLEAKVAEQAYLMELAADHAKKQAAAIERLTEALSAAKQLTDKFVLGCFAEIWKCELGLIDAALSKQEPSSE